MNARAWLGLLGLVSSCSSELTVVEEDAVQAPAEDSPMGMAGLFQPRPDEVEQEPLDLTVPIAPNPDPHVESGAQTPVDASRYPALGVKELGHLRWVVALGQEPLADFSSYRSKNQADLTAYRYSLAFAAYFLAVEQYHKLPAWTEVLQPAFRRHIERMVQRPVWEYWSSTSRGVRTLEPDFGEPYAEAHDPVADKNIMYSGHLGHMVNLYEMLYRDFHWDQPSALTFDWSTREKYFYSNHSLELAMWRQFKRNTYRSVCCEPNAVFPECNQHPVLSFMLYDHTHGTRLADVNADFFQFFQTSKLIDPVSHETAMLYLVKQGTTLSQAYPWYHNVLDLAVGPAVRSGLVTLESATANGWTGLFMHAWQPRYIEQHYPHWVRRHVLDRPNGVAELKRENWEPLVQYGFFAALAAELGDASTRDKLLNYADRKYAPQWENGTFHYPYDLRKGASDLTDRTLALARALPRDGLLKLHTQPFPLGHFQEPAVRSVDFPRVALTRAVYDGSRRALVVSLVAGQQRTGKTTFEAFRLDPARRWSVYVDGVEVKQVVGSSSAIITVDVPAGRSRDVVVLAN